MLFVIHNVMNKPLDTTKYQLIQIWFEQKNFKKIYLFYLNLSIIYIQYPFFIGNNNILIIILFFNQMFFQKLFSVVITTLLIFNYKYTKGL